MKMLREFVRRYPLQSGLLVLMLLLAGVADGIGLSALLPLLNVALSDPDPSKASGLEREVRSALELLGISPTLGVLLLIVLGCIAAKSALVFFAETRIGFIAAEVTTELRMRLLRSVMASRWDYFTHQSPGFLANSLATEAQRGSTAYIHAVKVLALTIETLVYAALAVSVSWLATVASIGVGGVILLVSHQLVRIAKRAGKRQTKWYRALLGTLTDVLQSVKTFKAMGRERLAEEVLAEETDRLRGALRAEVLGAAGLEAAQEPMYATVIAAGIFVTLVYFSVPAGTVMFMVLVLARLLRQIGRVQKQYQRMVTCESAYQAIEAAIDAADAAREKRSGTRTPVLREAIRLDGVHFAYGAHPVLAGVEIEIPCGELTCLVGGSGVGKSTTVDLVTGLIEPQHGQVLVDGVPLAELDISAWRRSIGYVPQENLLLHASILHNVTLGEQGIEREAAEAALEAAGALEFVRALPNGLDAIVGERGTRISGGQRQRIMIARALVHQPELLILDEATSALDPATERAVCDVLIGLRGRMTILAVSHQSALTTVADRVYHLEAETPEPGGTQGKGPEEIVAPAQFCEVDLRGDRSRSPSPRL